MNQQLDLFSEYKDKLVGIVGPENASSIINGSLYVVSAGNSDFLQNYFINLRLKKLYTVSQFSQIVLELQTKFIQVSITYPKTLYYHCCLTFPLMSHLLNQKKKYYHYCSTVRLGLIIGSKDPIEEKSNHCFFFFFSLFLFLD